jgi:hypothetical protein
LPKNLSKIKVKTELMAAKKPTLLEGTQEMSLNFAGAFPDR